MKKIRVGIVGCGAIGSEIASACAGRLQAGIELEALYDIDTEKSRTLSRLLNRDIAVDSLDCLVDRSDLVVEAASSSVSQEVVKKAIEKSKDVMVMSVGGLIESAW